MFGYVTVNQKELKFKEYDIYHAYYCGLCRMLGKKYGLTGRFSLTYDCTFLILFLSVLPLNIGLYNLLAVFVVFWHRDSSRTTTSSISKSIMDVFLKVYLRHLRVLPYK